MARFLVACKPLKNTLRRICNCFGNGAKREPRSQHLASALLRSLPMSRHQELNDSAGAVPRVFADAREREEEIERAAAYIGRLIREADSESRFELTEAATAILREEALSATTNNTAVHHAQAD